MEDTYAVSLLINGVAFGTKEVSVTPGSSKPVSFDIREDAPGTYEIKVDDFVATLKVKQVSPTITTSSSSESSNYRPATSDNLLLFRTNLTKISYPMRYRLFANTILRKRVISMLLDDVLKVGCK